jgi:hypothetical protein
VNLRRRTPELPDTHRAAWQAFIGCAGVVEGGRRMLLATIGLGVDAMARAIADTRGGMDAWRLPVLEAQWQECAASLDEAAAGLDTIREVAAGTSELEELQIAVMDVVDPLAVYGDAERAWRRAWRIPRELR